MTKLKTNAIHKADSKFQSVYLIDVPVFYASVQEPKTKYQSEDRAFQLTAFVDEATKDKLEDEIKLNKTIYKVGVDKNKKKAIKFPLSSQSKEGAKVNYDAVEGMYGFSLSADEYTKAGKKRKLTVIDKDGNPLQDLVGNMSICSIKLFAYPNQDDLLIVMLDTVQVKEHVAYDGPSNSGQVEDDILGTYSRAKASEDAPEEPTAEAPKKAPKKKAAKQPEPDMDFEEGGIPF